MREGGATTRLIDSLLALALVSLLLGLLPSGVSAATGAEPTLAPRAPILIDGDGDFTSVNGVRGTGTPSDPYVIEGWDISASTSTGITIRNTRAHAVVQDVSVQDGGGYYPGMWLENASNLTFLRQPQALPRPAVLVMMDFSHGGCLRSGSDVSQICVHLDLSSPPNFAAAHRSRETVPTVVEEARDEREHPTGFPPGSRASASATRRTCAA